MDLFYELSNRQQHALNRGEVLVLAIPLDPIGDEVISEGTRDKILGWLAERVPEVERLDVRFQGVLPIVVDPVINPIGSDLSRRLGSIVPNDGKMMGFVMDVAIFEVTNPDRATKSKTSVQWPGGKMTFRPHA